MEKKWNIVRAERARQILGVRKVMQKARMIPKMGRKVQKAGMIFRMHREASGEQKGILMGRKKGT